MTEQFTYQGQELELFSRATHWKKYMAGLMMPFIKGKVLEVGAGIGSMTNYFNTVQFIQWTLLEPDAKIAEQIKIKIDAGILPKNCFLITGTIHSTELPLYDTIIYIDVLEHIEEDQLEINKIATMLNPGGKLIVLAPAFQHLFSPFDKAIGHYRRYSKKGLLQLTNGKFITNQILYLDCCGYFSSLANKWVLRQPYPTAKQIEFWDQKLVPVSIVLDKMTRYSFGKSLLAIFSK